MYDKTPTRYSFGSHDAGAGAGAFEIIGPLGKEGRLVDYGVLNPTEAFTTDTLPSYVSVGTTSDPDAYGDELGLGTIGVDSGGKSALSTYDQASAEYAALMVDKTLPKDTVVRLTITAPTGGTPGGIATPFMDIIWDN